MQKGNVASIIIVFVVGFLGAGLALGLSLPAAAQCGDCVEDMQGETMHWFEDPNPEGMNAPHEDEQPGTCEQWHFWCFAPDVVAGIPVIDEIVELVEDGEGAELARLIRSYEAVITFNASRQAVQVLTCGGVVAAHLPASDELARAIVANVSVMAEEASN